MKDLKKYLTEGLLQVTLLLSLAGVRVDLDFYLPPIREIIQGGSSAYSQIPFHSLRDTWGGPSLHPKSPDLDAFFTARRLLCEVRSLGDPRIPRTELSAWLVHAEPARPAEHTDNSEDPIQPPARSSDPQPGTRATSAPAQPGTGATSSSADAGTGATSSSAEAGTGATSSSAEAGTGATSSSAEAGTGATSSSAEAGTGATSSSAGAGTGATSSSAGAGTGATSSSAGAGTGATSSSAGAGTGATSSSAGAGTGATSSSAGAGTGATSSSAGAGTGATSSSAGAGTRTTLSSGETGTRTTSTSLHADTRATSSPGDNTKEVQEEKLGSSQSSGYSFLQNEQEKTRLEEDLPPQNGEEESVLGVIGDAGLTNGNDHVGTEGTNENSLHSTNANFRLPSGSSMGELWQDLLSLPDLNITLEDIQPVNNINSVNPPRPYNVDFTEAISQDVSLREAMFLSNQTSRTPGDLTRMQAGFSQLNSSSDPEGSLSASNLTALFSPMDNTTRNLTHQDLLSGLDENVFDEINLMSLALEEGFDPLDVSQLFEEPDSDSGLSLNSSHSPTYASSSDSSSVSFGDDEGANAYSSDSESLSFDGLEGAVGGNWPEVNKFCHSDFQEDSNSYDVTIQNVQHNHTYNQMPNAEDPVPEHHYSWPAKPSRLRDPCPSGMDKTLSRDQRRAKSLQIPFSVDEIVSMPVETFNNMLTKHFLTDNQVSVIRDIRRRGKNKVAAQNCRKRKLDVILTLEDDVSHLKAHKERLLKERTQCIKSVGHMKQKVNELYRDVFSRLRDEQGQTVNPSQYALHCNSDGSIMVVPRRLFKSEQNKETHKDKKQK
uniref:NFE2 like bZIP transcription factor 3 n=1 Tax=Leptobrachium leishanense TaxID=445787 RepID=A0A8C5PB46_9ANUR